MGMRPQPEGIWGSSINRMKLDGVIEMSTLFKSDRILFRHLEGGDLADIAGLLSDPEVMRYCSGPLDAESSHKWLASCMKAYRDPGYDYWAAELIYGGGFIGQMGIIRETVDGSAHDCLAYMLAKAHWGKGYALEGARACLDYAFASLGLAKVNATVERENGKSAAILSTLGMGLRKTALFNGQEVDLYEITREDWESKR